MPEILPVIPQDEDEDIGERNYDPIKPVSKEESLKEVEEEEKRKFLLTVTDILALSNDEIQELDKNSTLKYLSILEEVSKLHEATLPPRQEYGGGGTVDTISLLTKDLLTIHNIDIDENTQRRFT